MSQSLSSEQNDPGTTAPPHADRAQFSLRGKLIELIAVAAFLTILVALLLPAGSHPDARDRSACKNNLKQIGLALHNYHDMYGCFPPAFITDDLGRPMHSWRVLILPFLDRNDLYEQYRFDEPWNGPNNEKLAGRIGTIFRCPEKVVASEGEFTNYVAVIGPQTAWPGATSIRTKDCVDGASSSILIFEAANSGIHWMDPRDLHVLQMSPTINSQAGQGISSRHSGGAQAVFVDGTVRFLSENLSAETIRALLTIKGGEAIPEDL